MGLHYFGDKKNLYNRGAKILVRSKHTIIYTICYLLFSCLFLISKYAIASDIPWDWEGEEEWGVLTEGTTCEGKVGNARGSYEKRNILNDKQLTDMLSNPCYLIQWISIQTIGERKDINKLPLLYKMLLSVDQDSDQYIMDGGRNAMILWAIVKIGYKDSVKVIISFLVNEENKNNYPAMIEKALYALGFFETEESINFLIEYANNKDNFLFRRFIALEMLSSMENSIAKVFMEKAQLSEDDGIRNFSRQIKQTQNKGIKWEKDVTELILDSSFL